MYKYMLDQKAMSSRDLPTLLHIPLFREGWPDKSIIMSTSPHIITRYQQERTNHRPIAEHILRDDIKQEIAVQMDLVFFLSLPTNWFLTRHQNGSQQKH